MSDTTNTQPPSKREKALKAAETIREACRTIYDTAFAGQEGPGELYAIYQQAQRLDGHIENALPAEPAKDTAPTPGA
jgi:hypothetical protein